MLATTLREWFSSPQKWTTKCPARNKEGNPVDSTKHGDIASMCLSCAVHEIYGVRGWNGYFAPSVVKIECQIGEALKVKPTCIPFENDNFLKFADVEKLCNELLI